MLGFVVGTLLLPFVLASSILASQTNNSTGSAQHLPLPPRCCLMRTCPTKCDLPIFNLTGATISQSESTNGGHRRAESVSTPPDIGYVAGLIGRTDVVSPAGDGTEGSTDIGGGSAGTAEVTATAAGDMTTADAGTPTGSATGSYSTVPPHGGPPFDSAGANNVGNGRGKQFIGGQCLSSADCGSGCCALPSGICSGTGASTQNGKQGCGFGDGANATASASDGARAPHKTGVAAASKTPANGGPNFDPSGEKNVGNGAGGQFIGGQCLSNTDCGSGCCAGPSGICSGPGAQMQNGKNGCGFGAPGTGKRMIPRLLV